MSRKSASDKRGEEVGAYIAALIPIYIVCMLLWGVSTANWVVGLLIITPIVIFIWSKINKRNVLYSYTGKDGLTYNVVAPPREENSMSIQMSLPDDYTIPGSWHAPVYTLVRMLKPGTVVTCSDVARTLLMTTDMVYDAIEHAPNDVPVYRIVADDRLPLYMYPNGGMQGQRFILIQEGVRFNNSGQVVENHFINASSRNI